MAVRLAERRRHLSAFFWAVKDPNQNSNREYRLQRADKSFLHRNKRESDLHVFSRPPNHGQEPPARRILHDRGSFDFMTR